MPDDDVTPKTEASPTSDYSPPDIYDEPKEFSRSAENNKSSIWQRAENVTRGALRVGSRIPGVMGKVSKGASYGLDGAKYLYDNREKIEEVAKEVRDWLGKTDAKHAGEVLERKAPSALAEVTAKEASTPNSTHYVNYEAFRDARLAETKKEMRENILPRVEQNKPLSAEQEYRLEFWKQHEIHGEKAIDPYKDMEYSLKLYANGHQAKEISEVLNKASVTRDAFDKSEHYGNIISYQTTKAMEQHSPWMLAEAPAEPQSLYQSRYATPMSTTQLWESVHRLYDPATAHGHSYGTSLSRTQSLQPEPRSSGIIDSSSIVHGTANPNAGSRASEPDLDLDR
jgi:hypothetical protein